MPYWWWLYGWLIIPALAALLAVAVLSAGLGAMLHRRPGTALGGVLTGGLLLAGVAVVVLLGLDIQTYHRLASERPVATIDLHQTGDHAFDAIVAEAPDPVSPAILAPAPRTFALKGDEWRIEARVLKWKPWANVLGLDALYRLERVAGEFTDTAAEQAGPHSVYDLRTDKRNDAGNWGRLWRLSARLNDARLIDTLYGSAALMPMADGAEYELTMTQSGLVARPVNDAAVKAVGTAGG